MNRPGKALARIALSALFFFATRSALARELWEHDWIEVRSPHFIIASALAEKSTVGLAKDLENFRYAASLLTNIGTFEERVPTRIFVLKSGEEDLGIAGDTAGMFTPGMRSNHAVLRSSGSNTNWVLKHEYVHFLVHNNNQQVYPAWYHEGFAELLSMLRVRDEHTIEYGDVPKMRANWLNYASWISFEKIISAPDTDSLHGDAVAMFYAQSWFLMHYLVLGRPDAEFGPHSDEFLRLSESGVAPTEAFTRGFGIAPADLRVRLEAYRRQLRATRVRLKNPIPTVQTTTRSMPRDEIAAELGWMVLQRKGGEAAGKYFDAALTANPANARALVGAGDVLKFAGQLEQAKPFYERALAAEPGNAWHELDFAEYFLDCARKEGNTAAGKELLVEARRHFARSYRIDPQNPETLAMNGASYLFPGEDTAKALTSLETAAALLPANEEIRGLLAQAYIADGNREAARTELMRLLAWSHGKSAEQIRKLLESLDSGATAVTPVEASATNTK